MSVQKFEIDPQSVADSIQVTDTAKQHFALQLHKSGKAAIRMSLKESGCTGYMYVIEEVDEKQTSDAKKNLGDDVVLYIDTQFYSAIKGTQIDFIQQGLNQNLIMNNPNVKDACGCGESFNV